MDILSPLARQIIEGNPDAYGQLVVSGDTPERATKLLADVSPDQLLAVPVISLGHSYSMLCGLWLWHDALHECHEIAQADVEALHRTALNLHRKRSKPSQNTSSVPNVEIDKASFRREIATALTSLNFWHAVMHRREGDFGNAKYWYARCRGHPAHTRLAGLAQPLLARPEHARVAGRLLARGGWDANAFVDLAEDARRRPADDPARALAVALQRLEWQALLDETVREAVG